MGFFKRLFEGKYRKNKLYTVEAAVMFGDRTVCAFRMTVAAKSKLLAHRRVELSHPEKELRIEVLKVLKYEKRKL